MFMLSINYSLWLWFFSGPSTVEIGSIPECYGQGNEETECLLYRVVVRIQKIECMSTCSAPWLVCIKPSIPVKHHESTSQYSAAFT